ncbi:GNAT family N-acetyltransferase [bacterium]|nr:GNAT family N-acetyltransferase [bacterium]
MLVETLTTDRLILRELLESDFDALFRILGDPVVLEHYDAVADEEMTRRWLTGIRTGYERDGHSFFAVELPAEGEIIGICGLLMQPFEGKVYQEVAYLLAQQWWGRGYATEAARAVRDEGFERFGYDHLISVIEPANAPSVRVAERIGMILERIATFQDVTDAHIYGMTRDQWDEIRRNEQDQV